MIDIKQKIIEKLEEYGIEVFKEFEANDNETILMADNLTISNKQNEIFVNFHIISKPSFAAHIILILKEIEDLEEFYVGSDFLFDESGKFLEGEDAYKYHNQYQQKDTIAKFMEQQMQLFYLNTAKAYHC